jgi:pimeloyl-ACP methyl ester carboxylesterase
MPLHVDELGPADAPSLLLAHGGGVGNWMWRPAAAELSREFHLLLPELPEHGRSRAEAPFTMLEAARRLAELIHERAHGGRAHLAGLSLGGQVIVALLGLAPQLADRVLVSGVLLRPPPFAGLLAQSMRWYAPLKDQAWSIRANQRGLGVPEAFAAEFAADTRATSAEALARIMTANLSFRLPPGITRLATPTLVCVGEREPRMMRASARELVGGLLGATGRLVLGAGHNWPLAEPARFARVLRAWLRDEPLPDGLKLLRSK